MAKQTNSTVQKSYSFKLVAGAGRVYAYTARGRLLGTISLDGELNLPAAPLNRSGRHVVQSMASSGSLRKFGELLAAADALRALVAAVGMLVQVAAPQTDRDLCVDCGGERGNHGGMAGCVRFVEPVSTISKRGNPAARYDAASAAFQAAKEGDPRADELQEKYDALRAADGAKPRAVIAESPARKIAEDWLDQNSVSAAEIVAQPTRVEAEQKQADFEAEQSARGLVPLANTIAFASFGNRPMGMDRLSLRVDLQGWILIHGSLPRVRFDTLAAAMAAWDRSDGSYGVARRLNAETARIAAAAPDWQTWTALQWFSRIGAVRAAIEEHRAHTGFGQVDDVMLEVVARRAIDKLFPRVLGRPVTP